MIQQSAVQASCIYLRNSFHLKSPNKSHRGPHALPCQQISFPFSCSFCCARKNIQRLSTKRSSSHALLCNDESCRVATYAFGWHIPAKAATYAARGNTIPITKPVLPVRLSFDRSVYFVCYDPAGEFLLHVFLETTPSQIPSIFGILVCMQGCLWEFVRSLGTPVDEAKVRQFFGLREMQATSNLLWKCLFLEDCIRKFEIM